jgi:secreted trypsin-like serine protease
MKTLFIFLVTALTSASCARSLPGSGVSGAYGIVGGTSVSAADPGVSSTVYLTKYDHDDEWIESCTGSLLAPDIVITAAHCINEGDQYLKVAFVLNSGKMTSSNSHRVLGAIANPNYNFDASAKEDVADNADIGLVRINGPLPKGYHAAQLLPDSSNLSGRSPILIAGFGITSAGSHPQILSLRKKTVYVTEEYGKTELMVGNGGCDGDSGGPAFVVVNNVPFLFGVFSRADLGCAVDSIYSRIDAYRGWIDATIASLRAGR